MILWIQFPEHITKLFNLFRINLDTFQTDFKYFELCQYDFSIQRSLFETKIPGSKKSRLPAWNQNYASLLLFFFFLRRCLRIGDGFADSPLVHLPGKATSADNSWTQVFTLKPQNDAPLQVLRKPECWGGRQLLETGILNIKSSHKIAQK